jgi:hypothetical protein
MPAMLDRQKLETVLTRRFAGSTPEQIAAAANAIMGLTDEWQEVGDETVLGCVFDPACVEICEVARQVRDGAEFRLLRRPAASSGVSHGTRSTLPPDSAI